MKIALIGVDADVLDLAEACREAGCEIARHEDGIQAVGDSGPRPRGARDSTWEALLAGNVADAVIVGRGGNRPWEERRDQLLKLATAKLPLLLVHPFGDSLLFYLELDMHTQTAGHVLHHYHPGREHPAVAKLSELARSGEVGQIQQILARRNVPSGSADAVTRAFARDAELLAIVGGQCNLITALGGGSPERMDQPQLDDRQQDFSDLVVQLSRADAPPVRWHVETSTVEKDGRGQISVQGTAGTAVLEMPSDLRHWRVFREREGIVISDEEFPTANPPRECIARFLQAVTGGMPRSTWRPASQAMELADSIEISLRKKRTIEVHFQLLTEQTAFRGTMSMLGCGMLLLVPVLLVAAGVLVDAFKIPILSYWHVGLLIVLVLFLALQLIPKLLFPPDDAADDGLPPHASELENQGNFDD